MLLSAGRSHPGHDRFQRVCIVRTEKFRSLCLTHIQLIRLYPVNQQLPGILLLLRLSCGPGRLPSIQGGRTHTSMATSAASTLTSFLGASSFLVAVVEVAEVLLLGFFAAFMSKFFMASFNAFRSASFLGFASSDGLASKLLRAAAVLRSSLDAGRTSGASAPSWTFSGCRSSAMMWTGGRGGRGGRKKKGKKKKKVEGSWFLKVRT